MKKLLTNGKEQIIHIGGEHAITKLSRLQA